MITKKEEQRKLNPIIEDNTNITIPNLETEIKTNDSVKENSVVLIENQNSDSESLFREVIKNLNDNKDIETKTELLDEAECYGASKLDFLADISEEPFFRIFMNKFKVNRVSLKRRGRQELIMALVERQQEKEREAQVLQKKQFGIF